MSLLSSSSDSFSIPSSGMESICQTDGPLPCGLKLGPGRVLGRAVQLAAICPAIIETEVIVNTTLAFFQGESSMTTATAMATSVSSSSVLSERRGLWEGVDLGFFFRDFPNAWIPALEPSSRAGKGAPIPIEFSGFLH